MDCQQPGVSRGTVESTPARIRISRRAALQVAITGLGATLLAACGSATPTASSPAASAAPASPSAASTSPVSPAASAVSTSHPATAASVPGAPALPTHVPITAGPAPDLPGSADGNVDPVFYAYPKNPFKSLAKTPGDGSDITMMSWSFGAPPTPVGSNVSWQAINKEVGANLKVQLVAFADYYTTKLTTTIAGGSLPDMLSIINDPTIVLLPEFFEKECVDLTPYVSGDAIKDYPNLAAIPTRPWKTTIYDGKIFGVPQPLRPYFWWFWVHQELLDQAGLSQPKNAADLKKQLQQFTKPQQNIWGIGAEGGPQYAFDVVNGLFPSIFKAPNNWAVDATGKFTAAQETEQFKASVAYALELNKAGVFDPDGPGWNTLSARDAFAARKVAYRYDGLDANYWLAGPKLQPPANVKVVLPFSNDGSTPDYFFGRPNFGFMVIRKGTSDARVKMLLRVLDYLAAPFGSEEYLLLHYGSKGVDYNMDGKGNPVSTNAGKNDIIPWNTIVGPAPVLYSPLSTKVPADYQAAEKVLFAHGVEDASVGLYSRTLATKNTILTQSFGDGLNAIIKGQKPMSTYDGLVKAWLAAGGAQAKIEFQQGYAAAHH